MQPTTDTAPPVPSGPPGLPDPLGAALAATHVGVWSWDVGTGKVQWSAEVETIFGLPSGTFEGTFDAVQSRVLPEDRAAVDAAVEAAIARAEREPANPAARRYFVEHRIRRADGSIAWIEGRGHIELDAHGRCKGMAGIVVDVTARKQNEEALRLQVEANRLFTELASDYVYAADVLPDRSLRTSIVAGSFERTTGHTLDALVRGGGWIELVHRDDRASVLAIFEHLMRGEARVSEYRIHVPGGEVRWLRDHVRPIRDDAGAIVRLVGGVTDITERKRLEAELLQARKLEAIGRLAGAVAHDFNNLLSVILSASESLVRDRPELATDPDLRLVADAVRRGGDLTRSLLTIGRRQLDQAHPITLGELVHGAEPVIRRALGARIAVQLAVQDPDAAVLIDRSQAHLLLLNLAINARDAMPDGGALHITAARAPEGVVPASLAPQAARWVHIQVADTGSGIAPEHMPFLFEPFFTTKSPGAGTGLGLATCHGVARAAGGTITVESVPGRGTTFRVLLPESERQTVAASAPILSERTGRETVLVVEDVDPLRALLGRDLRARGYTVALAASAEEALARLAAGDIRADLALLDVGLPGMSGAELAHVLAHDFPRTRVVLMSGNPSDGAVQPLVAAGVPCLQKPFAMRELADVMRRMLDAAHATRPEPA